MRLALLASNLRYLTFTRLLRVTKIDYSNFLFLSSYSVNYHAPLVTSAYNVTNVQQFKIAGDVRICSLVSNSFRPHLSVGFDDVPHESITPAFLGYYCL